jgi:YidC/Oxa1 family membrane protein insertase
MNKQEKLIAMLLGALLVGWMFYTQREAALQAKEHAETVSQSEPAAAVQDTALAAPSAPAQASAPAVEAAPEQPSAPEEVVELASDDVRLAVSSHGAALTRATLCRYGSLPGKQSDSNPPVTLDFAAEPALALSGLPGLPPNAAYRVERDPSGRAVTLTAATAQGLTVTRRIELTKDYQVKVRDAVKNASDSVVVLGTNAVSLGLMTKGASQNEILTVDSLPAVAGAKPRYWGSDKATKQYLVGYNATGMGCGGAPSAQGLPEQVTVPVSEPQAWLALKSRFFVTVLAASETNCGFTVRAARDASKQVYALSSVSARMLFPGRVLGQGETLARDYTLFIGPKKLALLQGMGSGEDAVMEFGSFIGWFCKLLLPTLNFFHGLIPDYGVAIILLTFVVRILFWPLTHKSTESMKRMQELQPKLKEIQAKFKDNPQKMQQETWAVYRENKVNPMSSCLPMLVQIPVFIALFTVLRSAVELRYAPFLWIGDLSEAENLFAGVLPIPLNILPVLMAATMALQSYLTPSAGDPQQQKMMMIMMPIMMLFMFYSFPAALSLYWTVSQVISIVQMLMMRRRVAHKAPPDGGVTVESPQTRQQRRAAARAG